MKPSVTSTISVTKTDWGDRDNIGGPDHVFLESLSLKINFNKSDCFLFNEMKFFYSFLVW